MSLPWMRQPESSAEDPENVILAPMGALALPKCDHPVDFTKINLDIRGMRFQTKNELKDRPVVVGAKQTGEEQQAQDDFYERGIQIFNSDSSEVVQEPLPKEPHLALPDSRLAANCSVVNIQQLNPLQRHSIKIIRGGDSMILQAPTGIGKTYAFLLPAIELALKTRKQLGPHSGKPAPSVLIMSNTVRLAKQTCDRCSVLLGLQDDENVQPIKEIAVDLVVGDRVFLANQLDIACATMGKLKATIAAKGMILDNVKMIILDEADKMTDESSFGEDVKEVMNQLAPDVRRSLQCCFFSATYLESQEGYLQITGVQSELLGDKPFKVLICPRMPGYITQRVIRIPTPNYNFFTNEWVVKMSKIHELLEEDLKRMETTKKGPFSETVIIFCETVQKVTMVTMALRQAGFNFRPISRIILKDMQEVYLNQLANCEIHGIVCTNIMARGIDVSTVKHTIVMEMSTEFNIYRHRIGRVGRDGTGGVATVLLDHTNLNDGRAAQIVEELVQFMHENEQDIPEWLLTWYRSRMEAYKKMETVRI